MQDQINKLTWALKLINRAQLLVMGCEDLDIAANDSIVLSLMGARREITKKLNEGEK